MLMYIRSFLFQAGEETDASSMKSLEGLMKCISEDKQTIEWKNITGSPISTSSGPSLVPPIPGMKRCESLFAKIKVQQRKEPLNPEKQQTSSIFPKSQGLHKERNTGRKVTKPAPSTGMERALNLFQRIQGQHKKQPTGKDFTAAPIQEVTERVSLKRKGLTCTQELDAKKAKKTKHPKEVTERVSLKRKEQTCTQEPDAKKAKKTKHPKEVTERVSLKRKEQTCTQEPDAKKAKKTKHPKEITEAEPVKTFYPCDLCGVLRDRLDKHYKFGHKMSWNAAKSRYRLTKAMVDGGKNVSTCSECGKVVQHLSQHLANMHGIKRSSDRSVQIRQDAKKMSLEDQLALVMPKKTETKAKKPVYEGIHIIKEFIKSLQTMRAKKNNRKKVQNNMGHRPPKSGSI